MLYEYDSNHFLLFYSFRYFIEYCNYFENFKYLIISHCSIVLDILLNIVITLKSQNLESNKVIIIIIIVWGEGGREKGSERRTCVAHITREASTVNSLLFAQNLTSVLKSFNLDCRYQQSYGIYYDLTDVHVSVQCM